MAWSGEWERRREKGTGGERNKVSDRSTPRQQQGGGGRTWPLVRPKVAPRYLARLGVLATAARTALSSAFWSAALSAGKTFFSPSLKKDASVPARLLADGLAK